MKLLIDAHLPKSICNCFKHCNCIHTSQLTTGNQTKDSFINQLSIEEQRAVITKDIDFYYSYLAGKKPYKLVLVKLGNMRLKELIDYFSRNSTEIINLLENNSFITLTKNKIKVLD